MFMSLKMPYHGRNKIFCYCKVIKNKTLSDLKNCAFINELLHFLSYL